MASSIGNTQVNLNGQFGELTDARVKKIAERINAAYPQMLPTATSGITIFLNPSDRSSVLLSPVSFVFAYQTFDGLNIEACRAIYESLFNDGLVPGQLQASLQVVVIQTFQKPLEFLTAHSGDSLALEVPGANLVGVGVRNVFRAGSDVIDIKIENDFQGKDSLYANAKVESQQPQSWNDAFQAIAGYKSLIQDHIVPRLPSVSEVA